MKQTTLDQYAREVARKAALRAYRTAPHGRRTARWKRAVWATAEALRAGSV